VFAISLLLRLGIIAFTPGAGRYIDIDIYRCSGALVKSGVNPWDFSAGPEIRAKLRENSEVEWVKESQERWNFYVSGNLPFNLLYFAAIDMVSHSSLWYRIVFAVQDSLCSVLIFIFVLFHWPWCRASLSGTKLVKGKSFGDLDLLFAKWPLIVPGALLGSLSVPFLIWGTVIPQDKGFEILLMVGASLCCFSKKSWIRVQLGPAILGLSVAFKGLGIFLAPWYFYAVCRLSEKKGTDLFLFFFWSGVFTFIWFLPYFPEVLNMMKARIAGNVSTPAHGSMWVWISEIAPQWWNTVRHILTAVILITVFVGILRGSMTPATASGALLMIFVVVLLITGSLDRMNMGITCALLLLGVQAPVWGSILALYYSVGIFTSLLLSRLYGDAEWFDGIFITPLVVLYCIALVQLALGPVQGTLSDKAEFRSLA
jgi:hypothetical protein